MKLSPTPPPTPLPYTPLRKMFSFLDHHRKRSLSLFSSHSRSQHKHSRSSFQSQTPESPAHFHVSTSPHSHGHSSPGQRVLTKTCSFRSRNSSSLSDHSCDSYHWGSNVSEAESAFSLPQLTPTIVPLKHQNGERYPPLSPLLLSQHASSTTLLQQPSSKASESITFDHFGSPSRKTPISHTTYEDLLPLRSPLLWMDNTEEALHSTDEPEDHNPHSPLLLGQDTSSTNSVSFQKETTKSTPLTPREVSFQIDLPIEDTNSSTPHTPTSMGTLSRQPWSRTERKSGPLSSRRRAVPPLLSIPSTTSLGSDTAGFNPYDTTALHLFIDETFPGANLLEEHQVCLCTYIVV